MKSPAITRWLIAVTAAIASAALLLPANAASASVSPRISSQTAGPQYVVYGLSPHNSMTLTGTTNNTSAGSSAELFALSFPFKTAFHVVSSESLSPSASGDAVYSFKVSPEIATQYVIKLVYENAVIGQTKPETVYAVSGRASVPGTASCVRPTCTITFTLFRFLPPVVAKYELTKPYYDYLGINWSKTSKTPPAPKSMTLQQGWKRTATTLVPNSTNEYRTTFTFSFKIQDPGFSWVTDACTIDSESKDGFGLPTSHGCGAPRVLANSYLG